MMYHNDHNHISTFKALHDRMSLIYIFQAFFTFIRGLIGIFVPIYLYSIGYSLQEIAFYILIIGSTILVFLPLSTKVIRFLGFKYSLLLSIPIYVFHLFTISLAQEYSYFILSAIIFGAYVTLFWPTMHCEVLSSSSSKKRGAQIGTLQLIGTLFTAIAPIIGGFYLEFLQYNNLLLIAFIMLLIGTLPLIIAPDIKLRNFSLSYKSYINLVLSNKHSSSKKAFAAEGLQFLLAMGIWPIILYELLNNNFFILGNLFGAITFLSVILIVYIKNNIDKKNKNDMLKTIIRFLSLSWFLRTFFLFTTGVFLYIVEALYKLTYTAFTVPFFTLFYSNAKKTKSYEYIMLREIMINGTKVLSCLFIIVYFTFVEENKFSIITLILLGIVSTYGLHHMREEKLSPP